MARPTQEAERYFIKAFHTSLRGYLKNPESNALSINEAKFTSIGDIALGLQNLAVGLRATYILLDQVNRKLDNLKK